MKYRKIKVKKYKPIKKRNYEIPKLNFIEKMPLPMLLGLTFTIFFLLIIIAGKITAPDINIISETKAINKWNGNITGQAIIIMNLLLFGVYRWANVMFNFKPQGNVVS